MTEARLGTGEFLPFVPDVISKSSTTTTYLFSIHQSPQRHSHRAAGPTVRSSRQHGRCERGPRPLHQSNPCQHRDKGPHMRAQGKGSEDRGSPPALQGRVGRVGTAGWQGAGMRRMLPGHLHSNSLPLRVPGEEAEVEVGGKAAAPPPALGTRRV